MLPDQRSRTDLAAAMKDCTGPSENERKAAPALSPAWAGFQRDGRVQMVPERMVGNARVRRQTCEPRAAVTSKQFGKSSPQQQESLLGVVDSVHQRRDRTGDIRLVPRPNVHVFVLRRQRVPNPQLPILTGNLAGLPMRRWQPFRHRGQGVGHILQFGLGHDIAQTRPASSRERESRVLESESPCPADRAARRPRDLAKCSWLVLPSRSDAGGSLLGDG